MSLERAQQIVARANQTAANSATKEMLKELLSEIYQDMPSLNAVTNIIAGTSAPIGGIGSVVVSVDKANPTAPVINLSFEPEGE